MAVPGGGAELHQCIGADYVRTVYSDALCTQVVHVSRMALDTCARSATVEVGAGIASWQRASCEYFGHGAFFVSHYADGQCQDLERTEGLPLGLCQVGTANSNGSATSVMSMCVGGVATRVTYPDATCAGPAAAAEEIGSACSAGGVKLAEPCVAPEPAVPATTTPAPVIVQDSSLRTQAGWKQRAAQRAAELPPATPWLVATGTAVLAVAFAIVAIGAVYHAMLLRSQLQARDAQVSLLLGEREARELMTSRPAPRGGRRPAASAVSAGLCEMTA